MGLTCFTVPYITPSIPFFYYNLFSDTRIKFYGDPLRDFSLSQFLERFAFKNPKKIVDKKTDSLVQAIHNKQYVPLGSRGQSVKQLTADNCTEDERFIFEYLNKKREIRASQGPQADEDRLSVDDDEFDAYLDGLGSSKKSKRKGSVVDGEEDEELDFLRELEGDLEGKKSKKARKVKSGENDELDDDWDSDGYGEGEGESVHSNNDNDM